MSDIYERIKSRREELGLTTEELAQRMGYKTRSSITKIETGKADIPQSKVKAFARALQTTTAYLMGDDDAREARPSIPVGFEPLPEMAMVPLVGTIACGTPILAEQNVEARIGVPAAWRADFALTCKGDSMAPRYLDGDIVCIRCQPQVENGQIAAVLIGDEATLKRFYQNGDIVTLQAENPAYSPLVYRGEELNEIRVEGRVVGFCRQEK
jgi:repressor LexA